MPCLVGIDNGLTVTKAVVFDETGARSRWRGGACARSSRNRAMSSATWPSSGQATAEAIREAVENCGRPASDIVAVAATAHGDGIYLLDLQGQPLGNGILSLDSRAGDIVAAWERDGVAEAALQRTGQVPHVSAPSALLGWLRDHEPERFARIGHVLACKDWLRFCLSGTIGTDLTEASTSFTDVRSQAYADGILDIFGLEKLASALPTVSRPDEVVGTVTREAAALTGLVEGTPVVAGLHDVTASSLGAAGYGEGTVAIVAGTYSINETVSSAPKVDRDWFCRNGLRLGEWNNMSISPASAANYDWFLDTLLAEERKSAEAEGRSIHAQTSQEIEAALDRPSTIFFHPICSARRMARCRVRASSACAAGTTGATCCAPSSRASPSTTASMSTPCGGFAPTEARLTGGISRNPVFAQIFADALGLPVTVSESEEAAAWGAGRSAPAPASASSCLAAPRPARHRRDQPHLHAGCFTQRRARKRYALHNEISRSLAPLWPAIEELAGPE